jgi:hypothetical protein
MYSSSQFENLTLMKDFLLPPLPRPYKGIKPENAKNKAYSDSKLCIGCNERLAERFEIESFIYLHLSRNSMEVMSRLSQDLYLPDAGSIRDKGYKAILIDPSGLVRLTVTGTEDLVLGITGRIIGRIKNPHRNTLLLNIVVYGVGVDRGCENTKAKDARKQRCYESISFHFFTSKLKVVVTLK